MYNEDECKSQLDDRESQLNELASQLDERESQLDKRKSQLEDQRRELDDLVKEIASKGDSLRQLKKTVKKYAALRKSSKAELAKINTELQSRLNDLMTLQELLPIPSLALIVGKMLGKVEQPEVIFLLTTVAEWARSAEEESFIL